VRWGLSCWWVCRSWLEIVYGEVYEENHPLHGDDEVYEATARPAIIDCNRMLNLLTLSLSSAFEFVLSLFFFSMAGC
jgi:hypothetical protein